MAFYTLGCRTNQLESAAMAELFKTAGWQVVPFEDAAGLVVVNTCTVTERSDVEARRIIRRARLANPMARIAVTGCYAQVAPDEVADLDGVNFVIGNNFKQDITDIIQRAPVSEAPLVRVSEMDKSRMMVGAAEAGLDRTRGSLKIQDGCDYKCTYCIIWEARGASRSLPADDLVNHLTRMHWEGFREIMLTGINIGQYQHGDQDLAGLLRTLSAVPGDFRLRLSSLDPLEVTEDLIATVAGSGGKICPYFHLAAQTAEDSQLKRMARRHHVADMLGACERIATLMPGAAIRSDIIVGFPGESDALFETTCRNLALAGFNGLHVFSYSKRRGTPAAAMAGQVPERTKKARAQALRAFSEAQDLAWRTAMTGQRRRVLVESCGLKAISPENVRITLMDGRGGPLREPLPANSWQTVTLGAPSATETPGWLT